MTILIFRLLSALHVTRSNLIEYKCSSCNSSVATSISNDQLYGAWKSRRPRFVIGVFGSFKLSETCHRIRIHSRAVYSSVFDFVIRYVLWEFLILLVLHKVPSIHPPSRALLRCLLITDLCVGLVSQPLFVSYLMVIEETNRSLCIRIEGLAFAVNSVLVGQSINTMTTISVDRLLALRLGIRYRQVVTLARVRLLVTMLWVGNIALTFAADWSKPFAFLCCCGWVFMCLVISSFCYFKIYLVLGYRQVKVHVLPLFQGLGSCSRRREVLRRGPAQIQDPAVNSTNPRVLSVF